jgi:hypothetical protein
VEQAKVNGASHFYRDLESHERLDRIRAAMVAVFGGMGKGSAIWSEGQWDKGRTAGIQAAILAFDTERKK